LRPGVLLYNPISNEGHLDSWHLLFIETFLIAGWNVVPVSTDPLGMRSKLEGKGLWDHPQLIWPKYSEKARSGLLSKVVDLYQRVHRKVNYLFESTEQRTQRKLAARFLDPQTFKDCVDDVLASHESDVSLVFNMYVDGYLAQSPNWKQTVFLRKSPETGFQEILWTGLCITPEQLQQDDQTVPAYYALPQLRGMCFLEENAKQAHQNYFPDKLFAFLPDITESNLPVHPDPLATHIKKEAAGRKIVFLGGSIGKQKNLSRWIELIFNADPQKWYFVQIGRINHNNLSIQDKLALKTLEKREPENLFAHSEYLPDEASFNAIISESDVIFAVYRDFFRSSNMLSKAAYFEKPILVSAGCLMGERVTKYRIGLAVAPDSTSEIQAGLDAVTQIEGLNANFANYRSVFSRKEFDRALIDFATDCVERSSPLRPAVIPATSAHD
jgi:hypothetical protein